MDKRAWKRFEDGPNADEPSRPGGLVVTSTGNVAGDTRYRDGVAREVVLQLGNRPVGVQVLKKSEEGEGIERKSK